MEELLKDTATWSLISGIALPYLIAVVNRPHWSTKARKLVAFAAAVVGGLLTSLATGAFNDGPVTVIGAVGIVLVASQTMYGHMLKQSALKLEAATSGKKAKAKAKKKPPEDPYGGPLPPGAVTVAEILARPESRGRPRRGGVVVEGANLSDASAPPSPPED